MARMITVVARWSPGKVHGPVEVARPDPAALMVKSRRSLGRGEAHPPPRQRTDMAEQLSVAVLAPRRSVGNPVTEEVASARRLWVNAGLQRRVAVIAGAVVRHNVAARL